MGGEERKEAAGDHAIQILASQSHLHPLGTWHIAMNLKTEGLLHNAALRGILKRPQGLAYADAHFFFKMFDSAHSKTPLPLK